MDHGTVIGCASRARLGMAAIAAALLLTFIPAVAAAAPIGPRPARPEVLQHARSARVVVTLPTWQDNFDWPAGNGYNGWTNAVAAPDAGTYAFGAPLGSMPGLSLWLPGDRWYTPGAAEWRFDAPGTTRIASADLHLAYRDNLFAHHCLEVGLRDGTAARDAQSRCNPPDYPATPDNYDVSVSDPSGAPSAKQAYLRVEFPPCHNANGKGCPKWIPSLDPAGNAPLARVKRVEMTLVDDDLPTATPSGPLFDAAGAYVGGHDPVDLTVTGADAGAGIAKLWAESGDGSRLAEKTADCDPAHNTAALGAAICPPSASSTLSISTEGLPEGAVSFRVGASDLAGNTGLSEPWSLFVDRTAPEAPSNLETTYDDDTSATFVTWEDGDDPDLADGNPGSGVDHDVYRYAVGGGEWTDWLPENERGFVVPGLNQGDELTIEVRTVDRAGNISPAATDILGVDGPVGDDSPDDTDPGSDDEYDDPGVIASAASTRDDTALAAAMPCSTSPAELFFPKTQPGNAGAARITKPWSSPYFRVARFNPFKPTLPKCRKTPTRKLSNGDIVGGTRDVGTFRDGTKLRHFSAQRRLGWLETKAVNVNGAYMRDSLGDAILRIKYVRGWACGAKSPVHGKYRYNVTVYKQPGKPASVQDCSDVGTGVTPPTLTLQGRACITGVRDPSDWVIVGVGLKNLTGPDFNIRGFLPASVVPKNHDGKYVDKYGKVIDMSGLPETGCGGTDPTPDTNKTFSQLDLIKFYYRQDNKITPTSGYDNYNAHDLGGRVDASTAYQYILINTTAVSGGGITRAVVPTNSNLDPRDGFSYCDPNGAGPMVTTSFPITRNGRTYDAKRLTRASVKPRVNWTYGRVLDSAGGNTRVYGWVPTSALAGMPAPSDPDCRLGDDEHQDYEFHGSAPTVDEYPHFFNIP